MVLSFSHLRLEPVSVLDDVVGDVELPQLREPLQPFDGGQPAAG